MKTAIGVIIGVVILSAFNILFEQAYADTIQNQLNEIQSIQQDEVTAQSRQRAHDNLQDQIDRLNNAGKE